jgi:glutamine amidotransferase
MNIGIINTFTSNIKSVFNALDFLGYQNYSEIKSTDKNDNFSHLIFPGNGSFKDNIDKVRELKLDQFIIDHFYNNKFFLGICIGMQILATSGEENSMSSGLNIIPGKVKKISVKKKRLPHIGWNEIIIKKNDGIFNNFDKSNNSFYFLHSYSYEVDSEKNLLATTSYDVPVTAIVKKNNFYGVQFHPEKSQYQGLKLIDNFLKLK